MLTAASILAGMTLAVPGATGFVAPAQRAVIGQFVAGGGQQRSWLTIARFLPNRTVIARQTKEMVLSTFMTATLKEQARSA